MRLDREKAKGERIEGHARSAGYGGKGEQARKTRVFDEELCSSSRSVYRLDDEFEEWNQYGRVDGWTVSRAKSGHSELA
jgi:hypothetical protein